jgi:hypothetical protein
MRDELSMTAVATLFPETSDACRELASRHSAGITVGLYWRPENDGVLVHVSDELTGESFVLEPPSGDALDAYYHPYGVHRQKGRQ